MLKFPTLAKVLQDTIKQLELRQTLNLTSAAKNHHKRRHYLEFHESSSATYRSKKRKLGGRDRRLHAQLASSNSKAVSAQSDLTSHCLSDICINLSELAAFHREFAGRPQRGKAWLLNQATARGSGHRGFNVTMNVNDTSIKLELCNKCFASLHGTSLSSVNRAINKVKSGVVNIVPPSIRPDTCVYTTAVVWIKDTVKIFGDYMPDRLSVVLPVVSRQELFSWYASDNAQFAPGESPPYKYDAFIKLLGREFPHVEFRKHKRFMQCTVCNKFDKLVARERVSYLHDCMRHLQRYAYAFVCCLPYHDTLLSFCALYM